MSEKIFRRIFDLTDAVPPLERAAAIEEAKSICDALIPVFVYHGTRVFDRAVFFCFGILAPIVIKAFFAALPA